MLPKKISKDRFQAFSSAFPPLLATPSHKKEIVTTLLHESLRQKASDINIEPMPDDSCEIFFRISGILYKILALTAGQTITLREALQSGAQDLRPGGYGVIEGALTTHHEGNTYSFLFYSIPRTANNSLLIRAAHTTNSTTNKNKALLAAKSGHNINKKIFIWQMGKVGSSTVYRSLLPFSMPCTWQVPSIDGNTHWPVHNNIIQTHSIKLLYDFLHYSDEEFIIISLVRDLLSRNISAVFQSMNYEEEWRNDYFIARIDEFKKMPYEQQEQEITQHLKRLNTGSTVTSWYDNILKSHFYYPEIDKFFIDIYSKPFDQEKGFQFYESKSPRIKMIVLRLEDLNGQEKTLGNFLGIDNFKLVPENEAAGKWYNPIYRRFKERYRPTEQELEAIYSSRFMKYFYSPEQIKLLTAKWKAR